MFDRAGRLIETLDKDYYTDGQNTQLIFKKRMTTEGVKMPPQITPRGWIFWTIIFYNLKKSHKGLSNEGSNFILAHKKLLSYSNIGIFLTNYLKLEMLASYNNLKIGQDSEFAKF